MGLICPQIWFNVLKGPFNSSSTFSLLKIVNFPTYALTMESYWTFSLCAFHSKDIKFSFHMSTFMQKAIDFHIAIKKIVNKIISLGQPGPLESLIMQYIKIQTSFRKACSAMHKVQHKLYLHINPSLYTYSYTHNKPIVCPFMKQNEVYLTGQNLTKSCSWPLDFRLTFVNGLDLSIQLI